MGNSIVSIQLPRAAKEYLDYIQMMGKSKNTVHAYAYDLELFFRFMKQRRGLVDSDVPFEEITVDDLDDIFICSIIWADLYAFMAFVSNERNNKSNTRARKTACLKSFFKYLQVKAKMIQENPTIELDSPKSNTRLPVHLSLDESKKLLEVISGPNEIRDYAILTLFLNCGLRLSELVGIDINKISGDTLTVVGKGNKERTIYLNDAASSSIRRYLEVRPKDKALDKKALFLSSRYQRISKRTVQAIVSKYIEMAGLDKDKYSTHKLRHTAATLMYQYGNVDIRSLQQILGHENVSTTQIYTHLDDKKLRAAVNSNPLAEEKKS